MLGFNRSLAVFVVLEQVVLMVDLLVLNNWLEVSHHVGAMDLILLRGFLVVLAFKHRNLYVDALVGLLVPFLA
jgi:hypothetical protein